VAWAGAGGRTQGSHALSSSNSSNSSSSSSAAGCRFSALFASAGLASASVEAMLCRQHRELDFGTHTPLHGYTELVTCKQVSAVLQSIIQLTSCPAQASACEVRPEQSAISQSAWEGHLVSVLGVDCLRPVASSEGRGEHERSAPRGSHDARRLAVTWSACVPASHAKARTALIRCFPDRQSLEGRPQRPVLRVCVGSSDGGDDAAACLAAPAPMQPRLEPS